MNLDEKIEKIITKGDDCPNQISGECIWCKKRTKELKQLFFQELKACLPPRKQIFKLKKKLDNLNVPKEAKFKELRKLEGFNKAIDEAEQNINKLSEEGGETK